jgi:hypothetical protein
MSDDPGTPLCSLEKFTAGPFGNLVQGFDSDVINDLLIEATRLCEDEADRRLVPFTLTETHRLYGMDPDEYADASAMPIDVQGVVSRSYASSVGVSSLVRHVNLDQYAPRYPDMWEYGPDYTITVVRSFGGDQIFTPDFVVGPEPDTGHVWFNLGSFTPVGSLARITYSGGYSTIPASLVNAGRFMAAHLAVTELVPQSTNHDPGLLREQASDALAAWVRS